MQQRSASFDVIKGIAILLVILGHVFRLSLRGAPSVLEDVIYTIHMPMFVLVTGYFSTRPIEWTMSGVWSFWKAKVLRLLLPLLFIAEIVQIANEGAVSLPLRSMVDRYWFTYALFMIFVVFFSVQGCCRLVSKLCFLMRPSEDQERMVRWIRLVLFIVSVPVIELGISYLYGINPRMCNGLVLYKVAHLYKYLLLGYFLGEYPRFERGVQSEVAGAVGFFCFIVFFTAQRLGLGFPGQEVLLTFSGLVFVYSAVHQSVTEQSKALYWVQGFAYLGRISLAVYFLHYFFLPDLSFARAYEMSLSDDPLALFAFQGIRALLVTSIILVPTLLLTWITRCNRYLRFFLYGEALPKRT